MRKSTKNRLTALAATSVLLTPACTSKGEQAPPSTLTASTTTNTRINTIAEKDKLSIEEGMTLINNSRPLGSTALKRAENLVITVEGEASVAVACAQGGEAHGSSDIPFAYCPISEVVVINAASIQDAVGHTTNDKERRAGLVFALLHEDQHHQQRAGRNYAPNMRNPSHTIPIEQNANCEAAKVMARAFGNKPDETILKDTLLVAAGYDLSPYHGSSAEYVGAIQRGYDHVLNNGPDCPPLTVVPITPPIPAPTTIK